MADKKISQLTTASNIDGSEHLAIVKNVGGVNQTLKTTVSNLINSNIPFPTNPNEGDTFISPNNDYYLYENSEWTLLSDVKIIAIIEQFVPSRNNRYNSPEEILTFSNIMSSEELSTRLTFTVFDIYRVVGHNGIKELIYKNKEYNDINNFIQDLKIVAGTYVDNNSIEWYENNVLIVYKEKINKAETPISTYSNGLYSIMKGRNNMLKPFFGVNTKIKNHFTNWLSFYNGNFGRYLMKQFWGFEKSTMSNSMIWYPNNLKTIYNQLELNTLIQNRKQGMFYNGETDKMEQMTGQYFTVINQPKLFCSERDSNFLKLINFGGYDVGYRYLLENDFMVLIYPCKAVNEEKYGFFVKPLGIDQMKVLIEDARNDLNSDDIILELKFGKTKHKIYQKVTNALCVGYYKRIKLFSSIASKFKSNIYGNTLTDIKVFTVNKRTKTRSNLSNAFAKLHINGVNMAASFISKRY